MPESAGAGAGAVREGTAELFCIRAVWRDRGGVQAKQTGKVKMEGKENEVRRKTQSDLRDGAGTKGQMRKFVKNRGSNL
jgi:hypothetical protein